MNPQTYERYANAYHTAREKWGLDWRMAWVYAVLDAYLWERTGSGAPAIISGYRTPEEQAELYRRYLAGDPGIQYRPARQSLHTIGQAIDVYRAHSNFDTFASWFNSWLGDEWGVDGSTFGDPGHFAIKTGDPVPLAY